ncbi:MAG TPA: hypothetical protein VFO07_13450 [Roseiflexaceae bacterium]|nr:hypothetical protein [Roseiflexaceae bacterium]
MPRACSILVVDNEPAIVNLLVEILTDEGYVAYSAPTGATALAPSPAVRPRSSCWTCKCLT